MVRKINEDAGFVHVTNPETGAVTILEPGDTVPKALEDLVGEHVTSGKSAKPSSEPAGPSQTPASVARAKAAQEKADADGETKAQADADAVAAAEKAEADKAAAAKAGS